ncbi:hypothetical protein BO70DRAFT_361884 [Aspergillus heteromorphus CBS 117.55]|uniref:CWF21 domain-containing protein n=1 Tax=Aspergillus heteromorphus CBS 117.55 TaxID=1448321 RepID=A0A317W9G1_9EURO|nr:uncharacterized protein BO70DRAFT_361884 [Aspergillus heteromorphus CBS 117.55]PWY82963.1 hypothetical protein BO70DRAFT_361884 [Aspergillus heteromorphus CBS 117.55]
MSSNVGLTTPRGSGTSGYVQRNYAFMKPRTAGYGAPYPPVSGANSSSSSFSDPDRSFKQRQPDKQILEHDRRRAVEVKVMEERERLEEENERLEEMAIALKKGKKGEEGDKDGKEDEKEEEDGEEKKGTKILSEEEIDERCEVLRKKLLKELERNEEDRASGRRSGGGSGGSGAGGRRWGGDMLPPAKGRRQLKSYQVHELAEAKIEESERLRRALGIREDRETGEISGGFRR